MLGECAGKLLAFHDKLKAIGWQCFSLDPCISYELWVRKFYANIDEVSFPDPSSVTIKIWGRPDKVGAKQINDVYKPKSVDIAELKAKGCKSGSWLA